jgi:hypothetical protein
MMATIDLFDDLPRDAGAGGSKARPNGRTQTESDAGGAARSRPTSNSTQKATQEEPGGEEWEDPIPLRRFQTAPFPLDALPVPLRQFASAVATATQTPVDLAAQLTLGAYSAAVAGVIEVQVRSDWSEPTNLWFAVALPPGEGKTPAVEHVAEPLNDWEARQARRLAPEITQKENERAILDGRLREAQRGASTAKEQAAREDAAKEAQELAQKLATFDVPRQPRLIADDCTPERLATLLFENKGRMAIISDEGTIFGILSGRYSPRPNYEVYLKGHAGSRLRVDRGNRPAEYVPRPAITVAVATQPRTLHGLNDVPELRDRGLLARFFYGRPQSLMGGRDVNPAALTADLAADHAARLEALLALEPAKDDDGEPVAHKLSLSREAYACWLAFRRRLEPHLAPDANLGAMTDWAGKLPGHVARLAGVLHMAEHALEPHPWTQPIAQATMEQACKLGAYFIPHAQAAFALMGSDEAGGDALYLLNWIMRSKRRATESFTRYEAFRGTRGRFEKPEKMAAALTLLEHHHIIQPEPSKELRKVGRPAERYLINPKVYKGENAQNAENGAIDGILNIFTLEDGAEDEPTMTGAPAASHAPGNGVTARGQSHGDGDAVGGVYGENAENAQNRPTPAPGEGGKCSSSGATIRPDPWDAEVKA